MKKLSIILACFLVALAACTKSKEVHPELGDGNDEIVMVGTKDVHVEYTRTDHVELSRVVFHYSLAEAQQFAAAEMVKQETFFELMLNDLLSDTLYSYYYELFYNGGETSITTRKTFHTQAFETPTPPTPPSGVPEGAINGLFSVSPTQKVYFSQGNLQYQASTNTWRFAEHQWDFVGEANANISTTYGGWIDLFGWGTSGWNCGNIYYHPWDYDDSDGNQYGPPENSSLEGNYANSDWGYYNIISNGGDQSNRWRTLNQPEWFYIFYERNTMSGIRYAKAKVNGINGAILVPDNWNTDTYDFINSNQIDASFEDNEISSIQWEIIENAGAIFLPTAGWRDGVSLYGLNNYGFYWSATSYDNGMELCAVGVEFTNHVDISCHCTSQRWKGYSVRLVQDANP